MAPSRARAQALVLAGVVRVAGVRSDKPGRSVPVDAEVEIDQPDFPWVSRGGVKLAAALDRFGISPRGRRCLDVGASTGGFAHVMLEGGAASVVAVDVGRGLLHERLRRDPRVTVMEGVNARYLDAASVPGPFDLITVDVSFISLRLVLPALREVLIPAGDLVALVKPQFEAGREHVGSGGVVRDPAVREAAITGVLAAAQLQRLVVLGRMASPLPGPAGNVEELVHLRHAGPAEPGATVAATGHPKEPVS